MLGSKGRKGQAPALHGARAQPRCSSGQPCESLSRRSSAKDGLTHHSSERPAVPPHAAGMESRQHNATKEPEIELFVKVGLRGHGCSAGSSSPGSSWAEAVDIHGCLHVLGGWRWVPSLGSLATRAGEAGAQRRGPGRRWRRGPEGCHAQHPRRCPGIVVVADPGATALLAAGVTKERAHKRLSKPR